MTLLSGGVADDHRLAEYVPFTYGPTSEITAGPIDTRTYARAGDGVRCS